MKNEKFALITQSIENDSSQFMNFLKARFPMFHNSNFFAKDFQYGIKRFFESKDVEINAFENEQLTNKLSTFFESKGIFIKMNSIGWKINYPQFITTTPGDPL